MHICSSALDKCYALVYSYGEICVGCNCCGRINKDRKKVLQARLKFHKEQIKENKNFNCWADDLEIIALQKKNMGLNIKYNTAKANKIKLLLKEHL